MNIEEIRAAREKAELEIMKIMERFRSDTGLSVVGCDVKTVSSGTYKQLTPNIYLSGVHLIVESI